MLGIIKENPQCVVVARYHNHNIFFLLSEFLFREDGQRGNFRNKLLDGEGLLFIRT